MTARAALGAVVLLAALVGCGDASTRVEAAAADATTTVRAVYKHPLYDGAAMRVSHEAIPDLEMPAMEMPLAVADPELLRGLVPGSKVSLTVRTEPSVEVVAVEALPDDTALTLAE